MSDPTEMLQTLGYLPTETPEESADPVSEDAPRATDAAPPSDESDDTEVISLDDALAELDGQTVPQDQAASTDVDSPEPEPEPTELAELQRQLDEFKAKEAVARAEAEEHAFLSLWQQQEQVNDQFFEAEAARIERVGREQGRTQDEIDLAIYRRVELGNGFGIERRNPQTGQMEVIGRIQAERELLENFAAKRVERERAKTAPSKFEQMVEKYALDETDTTALAKFINYPPDHLEEIAKTLGAKNQRLSTTQTQIHSDAVRQMKSRLSDQTAPGSPGAAPRARRVQLDSSRKSTEYVGRVLGFVR